ncbi:hypothetical protein FJT64_012570 [Amphibalanus amphitrite]|uniref:Uncharacterized protein n=1 Tax=Amphibalanus amphitrite TaxID=1232801 RepID=A0A6A4VCT3_AMPAM|nr:hypothetical protein FJT64_012570 [Amphibalanus amphitrite]
MVSLLRSCCCCSLRHGALAVAIVYLVLSLLQTLAVLSGWGWADAVRAYSYSLLRALDQLQDFYRYHDYLPGVVALAPLTVFAAIQLLFDSLLLYGVHVLATRPRSSRCHLLSWLIFRGILFGIITAGNLAMFIASIVFRYISRAELLSAVLGVSSVAVTIVCAASWYSWLVVLSFYWQLRQANVAGVVYSGVQSGGGELTQPAAVGGVAPGGSGGGQGEARRGGNSDQKWM